MALKKMARKESERVETLDQKKIRARNMSLEAKSDDPSYELVRMNTKLNAKSSFVQDEPLPRKSKSSKKVTFGDITPSASQYFEEVESEPISFMLAPLTIDTGSDLLADLIPGLSFEEETFQAPKEVSPLSRNFPMAENNTIIKRKKLEEKYIQDVEYYLGSSESPGSDDSFDEEIEIESPEIEIESPEIEMESPEIENKSPELKRLPHRNLSQVRQDHQTNPNDYAAVELGNAKKLNVETDSSLEDDQGQSPPPIEKDVIEGVVHEDYQKLMEKFAKLEASYAMLQEENKVKKTKYDDLQTRFSKLERMYAQSLAEIKVSQRKVASLAAEKQKLTINYESALSESRAHMKGLATEVMVLQTQCKTYKKQIEVYDREIFYC